MILSFSTTQTKNIFQIMLRTIFKNTYHIILYEIKYGQCISIKSLPSTHNPLVEDANSLQNYKL